MKCLRVAAVVVTLVASRTMAADTSFVQTWSSGTLAGWFSQAQLSNPGTGGVDGAGDGFLLIERTPDDFAGPLGVHARDDAEVQAFLGDYVAAGAVSVTGWFKNFGDTPIEVHVGIAGGQFGGGSRYMSVPGIALPVGGGWVEGTFMISGNDLQWIGFGDPTETVEQLMTHVGGLVFRHDDSPIESMPPQYVGAFGIDNVKLNGSCVPQPADVDCDGDVDLHDFSSMLECVSGPGGGLLPECGTFDLDGDHDVDWIDFGRMQRVFTGPG